MKIKKLLVIACIMLGLCLVLTSCDSIIATALKTIGAVKDVAGDDTPSIGIHEHDFTYEADETGHREVCSCGEKKTVVEHTYEYEVTTPSTCIVAGVKTGTCSVCGYQTTEALPLVDHTYGDWSVVRGATQTVDGEKIHYCTICSVSETARIPRLDELTALAATEYYGYKTLEAKGEKYLTVYNLLVENSPLLTERIAISTDLEITTTDLSLIFNCYKSDYPQHFWISGSYTYSYNMANFVTSISPTYSVSAEDLPTMRTAFDNAVSDILSNVSGDMTQFEKELAIHDALIKNAQYDETKEGTLTHTAYANLVLHTSVCDGYSGAFQYLLYCCGIQALSVSGRAGDEAHAWNIVRIENRYYAVDPTWDDPVGNGVDDVSHEFLNLTDTEMGLTHTQSVVGYSYPACTADTYNYYKFKGYTAEFTAASLGTAFAKIYEDTGKSVYEIYLTNVTGLTREDVNAFLDTHRTAIFTYATNAAGGVTQRNVTYSLGTAGNVITFTFSE